MARLTKGRRKIEMKKIADANSLDVAFTKRHTNIFKKASELCTLCGIEIGIIIFSPKEKVFSFGHPSIETILDRFHNRNTPQSASTSQLVQHLRNNNIHKLNHELTRLLDLFETEKTASEGLKKAEKTRHNKFLWDAPIKNLGIQELEELKFAMLDLKYNCEKQVTTIVSGHNELSGLGPSM